MKSRWIINLLLLMAIGILSLVARYEPGIEKPAETATITAMKRDEVVRIHLNRPVRDDLVLKKAGHRDWTIERTPALPAGNFQMNALLKLAEQKPVRSYDASDLDLSQLQLDPPYATAFLNDTAIEFGNLEPLEGLRYIRVVDRVHLIPDSYLQLIEAGYAQFVRRRLFAEGTRIDRITLPGFTVTRTGKGWTVDPETDVSSDDLQQFVNRWQEAAGLNVVVAESGQEGERVEISYNDNTKTVSFMMIERDQELILIRPDLGIMNRMGDRAGNLLAIESPEREAQHQS